MVFSSAVFLFIFLPVVFVLSRVLPGIRAKNILLLIASLLFYAFGEPVYILLMLASILVNFTRRAAAAFVRQGPGQAGAGPGGGAQPGDAVPV